MTIPIINENNIIDTLKSKHNPYFKDYYAFYSSWFGGIITHPELMLLPIDDHMVHRGDGVFEAMKAVNRGVYLMDPHLQRLFKSADAIAIKSPYQVDQMKAIILETLRVADQDHVIIRIFLSRGPGTFSVNPYDAIGSQLYVVITKLTTPTAEQYEKGVVIGKSNIPVKSSWMAQVKSCNYLSNVLMKKEAVDRQFDYVIGIDEEGNMTESATENIMIVDQSGAIVHPALDSILKGTTMTRACELARANGFITKIKSISLEDLKTAREVMVTGTSLNVLPVVKFENSPIGNGIPGPIAKLLNKLIITDIECGSQSTVF